MRKVAQSSGGDLPNNGPYATHKLLFKHSNNVIPGHQRSLIGVLSYLEALVYMITINSRQSFQWDLNSN